MYSNEWDRDGKILRDEIKRAIKHVDHEMKHALKYSMRHDECRHLHHGMAWDLACPGHATVDELMTRIDSSLSYLEDLPREKILPYEEKICETGDHMVKLKESLKK